MFQATAREPTSSRLAPGRVSLASMGGDRFKRHRIATSLEQIELAIPIHCRLVCAGDFVCRAGTPFTPRPVVDVGMFKVGSPSRDGREQVVALKCRGDRMGLDGIADGSHDSDAVALDAGEVLETFGRAMSRLDREGLVGFSDKGRLEPNVPAIPALDEFVRVAVEPTSHAGAPS